MSALSSTLPSPLTSRPASPRTPLDPRSLTSPAQIQQQLALLTQREQELTFALNALISDTAKIDGALGSLRGLSHEVEHIAEEVDGRLRGVSADSLGLIDADGKSSFGGIEDHDEGGLVGRVGKVWETSERVGGKVRRLDDEVGRVRQAADIVTEVLELKNDLQTLEGAIEKQDWELATRVCKRAMSVRPEVIEGNFAGGVVPTSSAPLPPPQALSTLRQILLVTFQREFDAAGARKDEQAVSRFFRLWPGIGAEEEGLQAYGSFVVGLVRARGAGNAKTSSPLYYLTGLTSLLESIALIIDQHQPVVEKYYGTGRMRAVIGRLQAEGDRVIQNLIEGWEEERRVGRLISETKQSKFQLLANPSMTPPLFAAPAASIAQTHGSSAALPNLAMLSSYAPGVAKKPSVAAQQTEEVEGPDPRDVDRVLGELVALGGRWALYRRFVWGRLDDDEDEAEKPKPTPEEIQSQLAVISNSASQKAIENLMRTYYEPLEFWFLRSSIEKAHRLDRPDVSSKPHLSSSLDDTFYLLKLVLHRVISSGSFSTLKAMRSSISTIVERDYVNVLKRKMESVYSGAAPGAQSDRLDRERRDRDLRESFIIYLNDLDVSADYMERLIEEISASNAIPQVFLDVEVSDARAELAHLADWGDRFRSVVKNGIEQIFNQLTRPKLRGLLDECYKGVSYVLDEDSFGEAEIQDIVRKRFIRAWDGLVEGHKMSFTDHNYQIFFNMTVEVLVRPWEKMVMSMKFTDLGAIRYDRDVRAVANHLSSQTSFGGARDKLTRLQQIGTVLNLDADEDPAEFYSNSGIPWRLSRSEYNSVVALRI